MNEKYLNDDDVKKTIIQYLATSNRKELQSKCNFNFDLDSYFAHKGNDTSSGSYIYVRVQCEEPYFSREVCLPIFEDIRNIKENKEYFEKNRNLLESSALNLVIEGRFVIEPKRDDIIQ